MQAMSTSLRIYSPKCLECLRNRGNLFCITEAYVICQVEIFRFQTVKKIFLQELTELRAKEANPLASQNIIALLMGMKFFRVKVKLLFFSIMAMECLTRVLEGQLWYLHLAQKSYQSILTGKGDRELSNSP